MRGKKTGGGSRLGKPNKATADVRAAIALIAQSHVEKVAAWLAEIEDPAKRLGLFLDLCEYHIPKLARTEHLTDPNAKASALILVQFAEVSK